jgi:hypothetical protein
MIQKSTTDPVIAEIHRTRREISERFHGDIDAIAEDAARRLAESGRPIWRPKGMDESVEIETSHDG